MSVTTAAPGNSAASFAHPPLAIPIKDLPWASAPDRESIGCALIEADLWRQFNVVNNEMIVTRSGRRMFPILSYELYGLNPSSMYSVYIQFELTENIRYKFTNQTWTPSGQPTDIRESMPPAIYCHPESPNFGSVWMENRITFAKLKLTNRVEEIKDGHVPLASLHRYQPRLYVVKVHNRIDRTLVGSFTFPETKFITVTAYQNEDVTKLKVHYNPFAKSFQEQKDKTDSLLCQTAIGRSSSYGPILRNNSLLTEYSRYQPYSRPPQPIAHHVVPPSPFPDPTAWLARQQLHYNSWLTQHSPAAAYLPPCSYASLDFPSFNSASFGAVPSCGVKQSSKKDAHLPVDDSLIFGTPESVKSSSVDRDSVSKSDLLKKTTPESNSSGYSSPSPKFHVSFL